MAYQVHWPNKYFFYPIGNTSAVCLTRDLPPRVPASLLLLGCGDPRNVLYTVFCESNAGNTSRKLDFTCCDHDVGVLARNVLLLSMIVDNKPQEQLWNIFYHLYLDKSSNDLLVSQCRRLVALSETPASWQASPCGSLIRFSTDHTLAEVRRFWQLYAEMDQLPQRRYDTLTAKFRAHCRSIRERVKGVRLPRSAGPLSAYASGVCTDISNRYWEQGVTFTDAAKTRSATILNPTFVYSRGDEAESVHYGQDPTAPFHLTAVFGNAPNTAPSTADVVRDMMNQFAAWCATYRTASAQENPPVVRFAWGDALAMCTALRVFKETQTLDSGIPHSQWSAEPLALTSAEYVVSGAPTSFDVIDTSNLVDHLGILNLLAATIPLLALSDSVLYTETLVFNVGDDPTTYALSLLVGDFPSMALMMDLCPVDYLSGFTSHSFVDGVMSASIFQDSNRIRQFQQVFTWKRPASADALAIQSASLTIDEKQLAAVLYQLYQALFRKDDLKVKALFNSTLTTEQALDSKRSVNKEFHTRESFVLFAKLVCDRLRLDDAARRRLFDAFLDLQTPDMHSNPIDMLYIQDFYLQLHRHGLSTVDAFKLPCPPVSRFKRWRSVPDLVRLILVVPRSKLAVLDFVHNSPDINNIATPPIECQLLTSRSLCIFSSIHFVFGLVEDIGTPAAPIPSIHADPKGWGGEEPLLMSLVVSSRVLTVLNKPEDVRVCFTLRSTLATAPLVRKLGPQLIIHEANFCDEENLFVFPEERLPHAQSITRTVQPSSASAHLQELGVSSDAVVQLDQERKRVVTLTCRVSVTEAEAKRMLETSKTTPSVSQTSPCTMRINFAGRRQHVLFPFPVVGSQHKIRIARKSSYLEVVVPLSGGLRPDGMIVDQFAVVRSPSTGALYPWNIHHLNLSVLPAVNVSRKSTHRWTWLNSHVSLAMSARESDLRAQKGKDVMMFVKDTMHSLYYNAVGAEGSPKHIIQLMDGEYCDMVLFIDKLRYDLASYTVVCEAFFMHLHPSVNSRIKEGMRDIMQSGVEGTVHIRIYEGEPEAWKSLLPAFAERCRTWEHTANCEYASEGRVPLSIRREQDPLCTCGRGKDVEGSIMMRPTWRKLIPFVTRVAISPIFSVPYLEPLRNFPSLASQANEDMASTCAHCSRTSAKDGGGLKTCSKCHNLKYCSAECQRADWKLHKALCRLAPSKA